jgi:hypothetical protein
MEQRGIVFSTAVTAHRGATQVVGPLLGPCLRA